MYVSSRAKPFLFRLGYKGSRGDVSVAGFKGLYHTFACSGKIEETPIMMVARKPAVSAKRAQEEVTL
jgi:hypothetical protein